LMVSGFPYFSLKNTDLRKRFPIWTFVLGIFLITLFVEAPQLMFFASFLLYTLSGPLLWCFTIKRRREKRGEMVGVQP